MNTQDLTEKENFMLAYHHQKPAWVPNFYDAYSPFGAPCLNNAGEPFVGGEDLFGSRWICTEDTGWQSIPDPNFHIVEDITEWKDIIHFPDIDALDWEGSFEMMKPLIDRSKMVCAYPLEGNFNRLQALMGTCEAMIAMVEEPEAVYDFFQAYTNFRCEAVKKFAKYFQPDIIINGDDICSGDGMFFSKDMYNELLKPFDMQFAKTALECGLIVEHHVCGKCENLIPDIVESGATIWQTAQTMNDLNGIREKYGDRLLIHGGWESQGPHNMAGASEESVRQAVRDCLDKYAKDGNFALFPIVMGDPQTEDIRNRRTWLCDECKQYSMKMYS